MLNDREHHAPALASVHAATARASLLLRSNVGPRSVPFLVTFLLCAVFILWASFSVVGDTASRTRRLHIGGGLNIDVDDEISSADIAAQSSRGSLGPDPFARVAALARARSQGAESGADTLPSAADEDSLVNSQDGDGSDGTGVDPDGVTPPTVDTEGPPTPLLPRAVSTLTSVFSTTPTAAWWEVNPGGTASVCVIVRTFIGQRATLPALLSSLLASGHPGLSIILADTGAGAPFGSELLSIAQTFNSLAGRRAVVVSSRTRANMRAEFPKLAVEDYGYLVTDGVLSDIITARKRASSRFGISPFSLAAERAAAAPAGSSRSAGQAKAPLRGAGQGAAAAAAAAAAFAKRVLPKALAQGGVDVDCDLVMATNGDNLYSNNFFPATLHEMAGPHAADVVGTHYLSHYTKKKAVNVGYNTMLSHNECGHLRSGADSEIVVADDFRPGCIELGAAIMRTDVLVATGYRFVIDQLSSVDKSETGRHMPVLDFPTCREHGYFFCADGGLFHRLHKTAGVRTTSRSG